MATARAKLVRCSPPPPSLLPVLTCSQPPFAPPTFSLAHSSSAAPTLTFPLPPFPTCHVGSCSLRPGGTCTYEACDEGYTLSPTGDLSRTCVQDGDTATWSGMQKSCLSQLHHSCVLMRVAATRAHTIIAHTHVHTSIHAQPHTITRS